MLWMWEAIKPPNNEDNMDKTTDATTEEIEAVARIGHGAKLHPCRVTKVVEFAGTPWARTSYKNIRLTCHCPDSQNGRGDNHSSLVRGASQNCNG